MTTDSELLQQFARDRSEKAFATLVSRHVDLVYSAALRQVRSSQLAEEVAQTVFLDLSRSADKLKSDTILTAWLYTVTRRKAIDVVRHESSRQLREQIAVELAAMKTPDAHWKEIEPLLDEAMETLDETDRSAILLRYFENKSLREVGESLGASDDAAQKRVMRAVEQLREYFSRKGVTIGGAGLVTLVSANAAQAAPIALSALISSAVITGGTVSTAGLVGAGKTLIMTTAQKTFVTIVLVSAAGVGIYEARQSATLRAKVQPLEPQQQTVPADKTQELIRERDDATQQLAELREEIDRLNRNSAELVKLRGEVARLRGDATRTNDPTQVAMKAWLNRVAQLKERLQQNPAAGIPELELLEEEDWLAAVKDQALDSENGYRRAMSTLRGAGENKFSTLAHPALQKYLEANFNKFPTDITQLSEFFDASVNAAMLQRWQIVPGKTVSNIGVGNWIITEKEAVDDLLDSRIAIGERGYGSTDFLSSLISETLKPVYKAYSAENKDSPVAEDYFSRLLSYATTPEQKSAVQKLIEQKAVRK